jgi:transposase
LDWTAKHVFQVHGVDECGRAVLRKRLRRAQNPGFLRELAEARSRDRGHAGSALLVARDRIVRARGSADRAAVCEAVFEGQKNDTRDAAAICEAISQPEMRFVFQKSIGHQDLQALDRIRSRLIGNRTQLGNQIRGILAEYGIVIPLHLSQVRRQLPGLFSEDILS